MCVVPLLHRRNNSDELPFRCVFFRGLQWQKTLPYKNYYYVPLDNFLPYVPTVLVVVVVVQFLAPVVFYYLPFQPKNCHGFLPAGLVQLYISCCFFSFFSFFFFWGDVQLFYQTSPTTPTTPTTSTTPTIPTIPTTPSTPTMLIKQFQLIKLFQLIE